MSDILLAALMAREPATHPEELIDRACRLEMAIGAKYAEINAAKHESARQAEQTKSAETPPPAPSPPSVAKDSDSHPPSRKS